MAQCGFCGGDKPIHPGAKEQYGEPVCTSCFEASYKPDPDASSDFEPKTYSRSEEFHASHQRHRGLLGE